MSAPLLLASASPARAGLLRQAGVAIEVAPAAIDEDEIKRSAEAAGLDVAETAVLLAETKARAVSARHPGRLVLGADQMLDCGGRRFDKPHDREAARAQLLALAGRSHRLLSAAVLMRDSRRLWHRVEEARLAMRDFSEGFLERYLDAEGDAALGSVGAYRLEGRGAQLFAGIAGDYFAILGLPLLAVLDALRELGNLER